MDLRRLFSSVPGDPWQGVRFEKRTVLDPATGRATEFEAPSDWSDTAVAIAANKYAHRAKESSVKSQVHRIALALKSWGERLGYFTAPDQAQIFYDELAAMMVRQIAAPNSPQWFNTGLREAYGLSGAPQGHWYVDEAGEVKQSEDAFTHPQAHACFIQSVRDDLVGPGGIFDLWTREARVFKYGSGSGTNFSSLRAAGESLATGGSSSGVLSFLRIGDVAAGAVESGGTTRRAAKMVLLDIDHPEIEDFIAWKILEEQKAAALIQGSHAIAELKVIDALPSSFGSKVRSLQAQRKHWPTLGKLDADWRSEAYRSISGQNSNNSVRVSDRFIEAMRAGKPWQLTERTSGKIQKELRADSLWDEIAVAAWFCADPGIHFGDTINAWHTCPASGPIRASNPCAEYLFLDDTGCNLASLNLLKFLDPKESEFDTRSFAHAVGVWTIALEITVAMAQYPTALIAERSARYRTLGLGFSNLGALLTTLGQGYGTAQGQQTAGAIAALMTAEAYKMSAQIAAVKGPFAGFSENREAMLRVMKYHRDALESDKPLAGHGVRKSIGIDLANSSLREAAHAAWKDAIKQGELHGYRNAQVTAIAPTGTIGLLMDCDTLGVEPEFAYSKSKSLAGGGSFELRNRSVASALDRLGYGETAKGIEAELTRGVPASQIPQLRTEHHEIFLTANELRPSEHIGMLAAIQPFISGGISKTINLPRSSSVDEVAAVHLDAWERGIKCISIYREGSKMSAPLTSTSLTCTECG